MIILETRSEIKVTVTKKWYATPQTPNLIPLSNNIDTVILETGLKVKVTVNTPLILDSYLK